MKNSNGVNRLSNARDFINQERIYIWLLIFIILLNAAVLWDKGIAVSKESVSEQTLSAEVIFKEDVLREALEKKPAFALGLGLFGFVVTLALILGLALNIKFLLRHFRGEALIEQTSEYPRVKWALWDVLKVIILFLFFGYIIHLVQGSLFSLLPFKVNDNFKLALAAFLMDGIALIFIIYFVVVEYGQRLKSLGLKEENFRRNILLGITGYIAVMPIFSFLLLIILSLAHFINYRPPPQPVFHLLFEEHNIRVLVFFILLVTVIGPVIEEVFFRGFMYGAIRAKFGIKWGIISTAALFSLVHASIVGFLPIMALGILLAYLYEKTGSLVSSITVHILHNSVMVCFVFLLKAVMNIS